MCQSREANVFCPQSRHMKRWTHARTVEISRGDFSFHFFFTNPKKSRQPTTYIMFLAQSQFRIHSSWKPHQIQPDPTKMEWKHSNNPQHGQTQAWTWTRTHKEGTLLVWGWMSTGKVQICKIKKKEILWLSVLETVKTDYIMRWWHLRRLALTWSPWLEILASPCIVIAGPALCPNRFWRVKPSSDLWIIWSREELNDLVFVCSPCSAIFMCGPRCRWTVVLKAPHEARWWYWPGCLLNQWFIFKTVMMFDLKLKHHNNCETPVRFLSYLHPWNKVTLSQIFGFVCMTRTQILACNTDICDKHNMHYTALPIGHNQKLCNSPVKLHSDGSTLHRARTQLRFFVATWKQEAPCHRSHCDSCRSRGGLPVAHCSTARWTSNIQGKKTC